MKTYKHFLIKESLDEEIPINKLEIRFNFLKDSIIKYKIFFFYNDIMLFYKSRDDRGRGMFISNYLENKLRKSNKLDIQGLKIFFKKYFQNNFFDNDSTAFGRLYSDDIFKEYIKENNKTDIDNDEHFDLSLHIKDIENDFKSMSHFDHLKIKFDLIERPDNVYYFYNNVYMFHTYGFRLFYLSNKLWKQLDIIFDKLIEFRYDSFGGNIIVSNIKEFLKNMLYKYNKFDIKDQSNIVFVDKITTIEDMFNIS